MNPAVKAASTATTDDSMDELRIMTFCMMGIRMGVDVTQISKMLEAGQAAADDLDVTFLHERLSFGDLDVTYRSPRVLLLRNESTTGVIIDQPEDIVVVKVDFIRPLPRVIEANMETGIIWGVALIQEEVVLLVDLFKLVVPQKEDHA